MENKNYRKIIKYRNDASIVLDDLIVLIRNGILANDFRLFSKEIMGLTPGFAFTLRQARALKTLFRMALKQYRNHEISDEKLMNYHDKAQMILQGKEKTNGGRYMAIISNLIHWKENKQKKNMEELKKQLENIRRQMNTCSKEMERSVTESRGMSPDSMRYRDNERNYVTNKKRLTMLRNQEEMLLRTLDEVDRREIIKEISDAQEAINKATGVVLGNVKETERFIANIEVGGEKIRSTLDQSEELGTGLFEENESTALRTDSGFGALVAAEERKHAVMENAGISHEAIEKINEEVKSEFAARIDEAAKEEK